MVVGYVRVSTVEQNEGRQMVTMDKYNVEKLFIEKVSATKTATVKANTKGFKARSMATPDTRISTLGTTHYPSTMSESYQSNNSVTYNGDLVFKSKGDIDYFLKQTARAIDRRY